MAQRPLDSAASSTTAATMGDDHAFPSQEIHALARSYSRHSQNSKSNNNTKHLDIPSSPFDNAEGTPIDPHSPNFSARAWTEAMLRLQDNDPLNPTRRAGVSFRDLTAHGYGSGADYQQTVSTALLSIGSTIKGLFGGAKGQRVDILQGGMDGLVRSGEMLVVLGPPGSGCSTFLKTITGETDGFVVEGDFNYEGISAQQMHKDFRGEAVYTAEVDVHFPRLSVGDTLLFAAKARAPRNTPGGVHRDVFAQHMRDVTMAFLGISHTINTQVGDDFVRGVSGGERKRVTIAEASLSGAPLQCWDNSTRGLDSANSIEFIRNLKLITQLRGATALVAIYQSPQTAYDFFDKVTVLYEGRQIYFGRADAAKDFFLALGFKCPDRQTTADFLTSLTSDQERLIEPWAEKTAPRTPDQFVQVWKASKEYQELLREIEDYNNEFAIGGSNLEKFVESRRAQQAKAQRASSPYTLSFLQQVRLCTDRGFKRLIRDPEFPSSMLIGNFCTALILGSVWYNMPQDTSSFFRRGSLLFFAILMAAFASILEILTLYAQRNIVEKHVRLGYYHASAEAIASMICDLPYKISNAILFGTTIYFMANLNRAAGPYFFFLFTTFVVTMAMSMIFRVIAAVSRTLSQALAPAAVLILGLCMFTGFAIPVRDMLGWSAWMRRVNPISYGFSSLMVNEFSGRDFDCSVFVPAYPDATGLDRVCSTVGSVPGSSVVSGTDYVNISYGYYESEKWMNIGILFAFIVIFGAIYVFASEYITAQKSKGEVLVFPRKVLMAHLRKHQGEDLEAGKLAVAPKGAADVSSIPRQTAVFQWEDVVYDIKIKGEPRRILDHVDGWVKPGTLTALMGVSGAGKTTLLDVLATRVTMGVVTGKMLVDGKQRDDSFQRKTGYVQQSDIHLAQSTVREALTFSALLRQPGHISREDKIAYVDEVLAMLDMEPYADAVVGVPGEGLNVEQRKRLTIGVELAAKPELLLFLDEPTSGLDSQTSWAICDLMTKLANHGQAILCTIHQPSAMLFQRFDRLLFLAKGGRTIYFGEVGANSRTLTDYFEANGAFKCPEEANPAEWMLEVIGAAPGSHSDIDWHQTWLNSPERTAVKDELRRLETERGAIKSEKGHSESSESSNATSHAEFAAPLSLQFSVVLRRVFQQYWRTPSYIYSKMVLCLVAGLYVGFAFFKASSSQQGLANQMFGVFMLMTVFGTLMEQIIPNFVLQRTLYEARERPAKTYSWKVFMLASMVVEIPFNALAALILFVTVYYPIGLYRNAQVAGQMHERGFLFFFLLQIFLLYTSTFASFVIAGIESVETASNLGNLILYLSLIFCGVLAGPATLPRFWIFMYRVSPFTYFIEGFLVTGLANAPVVCSDIELLHFEPGQLAQTCGEYMVAHIDSIGGYLTNPNATTDCSFCPIDSTNTFLTGVSSSYGNRWRDVGILFGYLFANVFLAFSLYYLVRVPKKQRQEKTKKE